MKNITVIGAGTMGNGIAHVFAQNGYEVILMDISKQALEKGFATISKNLDRMVSKDRITESDRNDALGRIHLNQEMEKAVAKADLVVEAATERES